MGQTAKDVGGATCSVCGGATTAGASVRDAQGRVVCHGCVEQARRVLTLRAAQRKRQQDDARKAAEVERSERDNSLVMDLREDAVLESIARRCAACGKFLDLIGNHCPTCGVLGANAASVKTMKWGKGAKAGAWQASANALFPQLDPRLAAWVPRGLAGAFAIGLGVGLWERWLWMSTVMALACFAIVVAGLVVYVCWQRSARLGAVMLGVATLGTAALMLAPRMSTLPVAWGLRAAGVVAIIVLGTKGLRAVVDRPVRAMWWVAVGGVAVVLARAAYSQFAA
jgi:hypothetical protein